MDQNHCVLQLKIENISKVRILCFLSQATQTSVLVRIFVCINMFNLLSVEVYLFMTNVNPSVNFQPTGRMYGTYPRIVSVSCCHFPLHRMQTQIHDMTQASFSVAALPIQPIGGARYRH